MEKIKYPPDLTGIVFGKLKVLRIDADNPKKWICECECKSIKSIARNNLVTGHTESCGCTSKKYGEIIGTQCGKLTVLSRDENKASHYICKCECGNVISAHRQKLISGHTKSCGCLNDKSAEMIGKKYGILTVTGISEERKRGYRQCICDCDCGTKGFLTPSEALRRLRTISCGCKTKDALQKAHESFESGAIDDTNVYKLGNTLASNNTSGHTGVYWHKRKKRWTASITFKKKVYFLGFFDDIEKAVKARKNAEQVTHEAFIEWYEKYKDNLDDAPESPDGSELEKK